MSISAQLDVSSDMGVAEAIKGAIASAKVFGLSFSDTARVIGNAIMAVVGEGGVFWKLFRNISCAPCPWVAEFYKMFKESGRVPGALDEATLVNEYLGLVNKLRQSLGLETLSGLDLTVNELLYSLMWRCPVCLKDVRALMDVGYGIFYGGFKLCSEHVKILSERGDIRCSRIGTGYHKCHPQSSVTKYVFSVMKMLLDSVKRFMSVRVLKGSSIETIESIVTARRFCKQSTLLCVDNKGLFVVPIGHSHILAGAFVGSEYTKGEKENIRLLKNMGVRVLIPVVIIPPDIEKRLPNVTIEINLVEK